MPVLLASFVLAKIPDLPALEWKYRVLLLFAPDPNDRSLVQQKARLNADSKGLEERDIKVFEITGASPEAAALRSRFGVRADRFAIVLVGKDGGGKLKKYETVEPTALYGNIDSMPMRRDEMKRSSTR